MDAQNRIEIRKRWMRIAGLMNLSEKQISINGKLISRKA